MTIDKYIALNERFPLEEISDSKDSEHALLMLSELTSREDELSLHEFAYLSALDELIRLYADSSDKPLQSVPANEFLQHLLDEEKLSVTQLAGETSIDEKTIERFLSGEGELFGSQIKKLGERFSINPVVFLL